ncbi:MAG: GldG family protein [Deltaproteobacteria bacterium]|nr:GldG family protein [Deltaproteobacteria bacterium]
MKKRQKVLGSTAISIVLVLIIIVAINVISAGLYSRLDITEENLYTLSEGTENIVEKIATPLTLKYYLSKNLESLPIVYKNYGKKISELLNEYQNLNPEMIRLETYDPKPDSDEEVWAKKYGLSGVDLSNGEKFYMGLVITQEDRELNIPMMDPRREQFLEYDITQMLLQLSQKKDKKIGILSSIPVMGVAANRMQQMQGQRNQPKWFFIQELEKTFKIETFASAAQEIAADISILIVIHPKKLSENTLYAIDQFVLKGGELIVLVDPNARVDPTAAMMAQMGQMPQASSDLEKLFKHWGVDYQASKILGDKEHPTRVNAGGSVGVVSYTLWHSLNRDSFEQDLIATKELEDMLLIEPGGFMLQKSSPLKLQPLIKSSTSTGLVENIMIRFADPLKINNQVKPTGKSYILAGILSGKLTSAFSKRPAAPKSEGKGQPEKIGQPKPHLSDGIKESKILLITDVDFISDNYSVEQFNLLGQVYSQPKNDNLTFMVNMVEFLGGAGEMMGIRSRGRFRRPFTHFLMLEKNAQVKYQAAESRITTQLKEVQEKLSKLNVQKGTNKIVLTKEQIEKIKQFKEEEKKTKTELRKIRKLLRQDIESEKTNLTLINLTIVPILLILTGLFLYYRRFRKKSN